MATAVAHVEVLLLRGAGHDQVHNEPQPARTTHQRGVFRPAHGPQQSLASAPSTSCSSTRSVVWYSATSMPTSCGMPPASRTATGSMRAARRSARRAPARPCTESWRVRSARSAPQPGRRRLPPACPCRTRPRCWRRRRGPTAGAPASLLIAAPPNTLSLPCKSRMVIKIIMMIIIIINKFTSMKKNNRYLVVQANL